MEILPRRKRSKVRLIFNTAPINIRLSEEQVSTLVELLECEKVRYETLNLHKKYREKRRQYWKYQSISGLVSKFRNIKIAFLQKSSHNGA